MKLILTLFAGMNIFRADEKPFGIISHFEARQFESFKKKVQEVNDVMKFKTTFDLGRSTTDATLCSSGLYTTSPEELILTMSEISDLAKKEGSNIFYVLANTNPFTFSFVY